MKKLYEYLTIFKENKYVNIVMNLISDENFWNYLDNQEKIIVLDDLHRDNIIFNGDGTITFIDFTCLKKYPKDYQLASLIVNLMVLYDVNKIYFIINDCPEKVDLEYVNKLIIFRIIKGLAYYEKYLQKFKNELYDKKVAFLRKQLDNMVK